MKIIQSHKLVIAIVAIFSLIVVFFSCHHEPYLPIGTDTVCFDTVHYILNITCNRSGCHDGSSHERAFDPTSYESILKSVSPGNAIASKLYKAITDFKGDNFMPPSPNQPLSEQQRMLIEIWIEQGAVDKICHASSDSDCFVQSILPLITSSCAITACHDGLSISGEDTIFALNSYASILKEVVPGSPSESPLYVSVLNTGADLMPPPPYAALTSSQKETMQKWIADGALNSDCSSNCDTSGTIGYTAQIKPIIDNNCVSCHSASVTSGGVNLDGYSHLQYYGTTLQNGTPILVGVISQMSGFKKMPPSGKLDNCSIRKIELWINQGTPQ